MIKRIVKMTFKKDNVDDFLEIFHQNKNVIRYTEGCQHLELLRSKSEPDVLFTYSLWTSEKELNAYRHSDYFQNTWKRTKLLFADTPVAWTLDSLEIL